MMAIHIRSMALALGMTLALAGAQSSAQDSTRDLGQAVIGAPIVPPTHSVEQADAKLEEVAKGRAALEAQFGAREQVCNARFFVNNCLDKAKEQRRSGLAHWRAIEVEARHFKRAASVEKRDEALAESVQAAREDGAQRAAAPPKRLPQVDPAPAPLPTQAKSQAQRQVEYDAKTQARQARDAAEAGQRAANAAAFEARQRESEARQRRVLAKQAEKQEKARKDAAAAEDAARKEAAAAAAAAKKK